MSYESSQAIKAMKQRWSLVLVKYEIAVFGMCVLLTLGNCASGPHIIDFMSGRFGPVEI